MRNRNLLFRIRWGVNRYDPQRLCGGYSSGLRGVAMNQHEYKQLQEAIDFLKKGHNDLASENTQLKIDLLNALDSIKTSGFNGLLKKVFDREATIKQQTALILQEMVKTQTKIIDKIDELFLRIEKLEEKKQ